MKTKLFSIYDSKTEVFSQPFHVVTTAQAIREFQSLVGSSDNMIGKFPEDYSLFEVAEFDDNKCVYENLIAPSRVCLATEFVQSMQERMRAAFSGGKPGAHTNDASK